MNKTTRSHDDWLKDQLANDHEFMVAYLQSAMEESQSQEELLLALRAVVEAQGINVVAEKVGVQRESLSRALTPKGNPTLRTLAGIFKAIGVKISVSPDNHAHAG